ncbi:MAG TPA: AAA family ATPase [Acidimicrobiales bacterium]
MRPVILVVLGYPGTGKFTVSKELVSRFADGGRPVRLVDNHATANVLFDLIAEADGQSVLPPKVLENVREMNLIVARTIEELSPPEWSFVFTHHLRNNERSHSYLGRLQGIAKHRDSTFLPVVLTCEKDVLIKRVTESGRRDRNKLVDPSIAGDIIEGGMLVPVDSLTIDTTLRSPMETARIILDELVRRAEV